MKKTYKFTIAYDGSRYFGWEHQPDRDTIQGKLESVLERMTGTFTDDAVFRRTLRESELDACLWRRGRQVC